LITVFWHALRFSASRGRLGVCGQE
jgi:hypothetical protein